MLENLPKSINSLTIISHFRAEVEASFNKLKRHRVTQRSFKEAVLKEAVPSERASGLPKRNNEKKRKEKRREREEKGKTITGIDLQGNGSCSGFVRRANRKWNASDLRAGFCVVLRRERREEDAARQRRKASVKLAKGEEKRDPMRGIPAAAC